MAVLRTPGATRGIGADARSWALVLRQSYGASPDRKDDPDPESHAGDRQQAAGLLRPGARLRARRRHLDIGSLLHILKDHAAPTPERLLFLWNLFEGVPKFYRDCYEQQVLAAERTTLLRRIFFESSSPLRSEAENWFLRELRGRYDVVLKFVARNPGRVHNELVQAILHGFLHRP